MSGDNDISSMLGGLFSDPEMLSKAMGMASMLKNSGIIDAISGKDHKADGENTPEENEKHDDSSGKGSDIDGENKTEKAGHTSDSRRSDTPGDKERIILIKALIPYLSEQKREKAEMLIRILSLLSNVSAIRG